MIDKKNTITINILLHCLCVLIAIFFIVIYFFIVYKRIDYPFDLEWIEGGMVEVVNRVVEGKSIYVSPSIEYVPFLYPPVFFYLSALVAKVIGTGYLPLRVVSFVASVLSFYVIYLIVFNKTKTHWVSILAVGMFAATYDISGNWLDIGRVDSLFLFFILVTIYFVINVRNSIQSVLIGICFSLSILTKQTGLVIVIPLLILLLVKNWRYALISFISGMTIILISTIIFEQSTDGWYTFYVCKLLFSQTEWIKDSLLGFWFTDLIVPLPIFTIVTFYLFTYFWRVDKLEFLQWILIVGGVLLGAFFTRAKIGGYNNVLLPLYAILSVTFGIGFNKIADNYFAGRNEHLKYKQTSLYLLCILQFVLLFYNPTNQIPSTTDFNRNYQLLEKIYKVKGEVYLPEYGYIAAQAGKNTYAHQSAIWDILRGNRNDGEKAVLIDNMHDAISNQIFDLIMLDPTWNYCCSNIDEYYAKKGKMFSDANMVFPVTGWQRKSNNLYYAKRLNN